MIRYGLIRLLSQVKVLNPHSIIITEIQKNQGKMSFESVQKITQMLNDYENLKDKLFILALGEISNYPIFKPFFKEIQAKLITQMPLITPQDLVKLTQTLSKVGLLDESNSEVISNLLVNQIESLDLLDIGSLLFSYHKIKTNHGLLVNKLTQHALSLIKSASKTDLLKILKSFSYYPETGFNKQAFAVVEQMSKSLTKLEIIDFLEQVWKCRIHAGSFEFQLFSDLRVLTSAEYASLVNRCSRYREMMAKYREKLLKSLIKRDPSEFSNESMLFVVNGLHELGNGWEVCNHFEKHIENHLENIELKYLSLIMYVMGIKKIGSRKMWRSFDRRIKEHYKSISPLEKIWSIYGLFKAGRLKLDLYELIIKSLEDFEWCAKSLEKVFEIADQFKDSKTIEKLIPLFLKFYQDFLPNKGLICLDVIKKANLMTPQLYSTLKYFKGQISLKPPKLSSNQTLSLRSIRNSVLNPAIPDSEKVLVKGKTKSPTGWVSYTGENSPTGRVPVASFKLPPINLEVKKSSLSESKSEPILKNSVNFRPPSPKLRGSVVLDSLSLKNEPFKARGSILIDRKDEPIQLKEKNHEPSSDSEEEKHEKQAFASKRTLIQADLKVPNFVTRCACKSQTGSLMGKKKKHNQDSWLIEQKLQGVKGQFLFTVCDGHGDKGHKISTLIKKNIVSCVESSLNSTIKPDVNISEVFSAGVKQMVSIVEDSQIEMKFNGSTMVSVLVRGNQVICANIGDSRAVIGRKMKNHTWKALDLSSDHKPTRDDEARRVCLAGGVVRQHRMSNGTPVGPLRVWSDQKDSPGLAMTRSVGDLSAKKYGLISEPETTSKTLSKKDKFMILATDGIWEFITSQESVEIVKEVWKKGKSEACCDKLIEVATSRWEGENVIDDITVLVVFFK